MSITWILVANARRARLFAHHGPNKGLELVEEALAEQEAAPATRKAADGRASPRREGGRRTGARSFAHRLALGLCEGRSRGRFAQAILVAPPEFMGLLNAELDSPTAALVSSRLDKDYTRAPANQLSSGLAQCLCV